MREALVQVLKAPVELEREAIEAGSSCVACQGPRQTVCLASQLQLTTHHGQCVVLALKEGCFTLWQHTPALTLHLRHSTNCVGTTTTACLRGGFQAAEVQMLLLSNPAGSWADTCPLISYLQHSPYSCTAGRHHTRPTLVRGTCAQSTH